MGINGISERRARGPVCNSTLRVEEINKQEAEIMEKTVIVTGGGQGIGKGIALELLRQGYRVAIAEIDAEAGEETAQEYAHLGAIRFFRTDTSDESSVRRTVRETMETYGRIDALINNAGIADPVAAPVEELSIEQWSRIIGVNLTGYFICVKHCVPELRKQRGSIVNIASTRAFQSEPNTEAYSATKGGVLSLTHALAVSLGPEIRVNSISPGWIDVSEWKKRGERHKADLRPIDHEQHPAGRVGWPADIAWAAAYLIGEQAGFITGQNFVIDGGMTKKMVYAD